MYIMILLLGPGVNKHKLYLKFEATSLKPGTNSPDINSFPPLPGEINDGENETSSYSNDNETVKDDPPKNDVAYY